MLTPYLPDAASATGAGMVVCPGGGYSGLSMDHEGRAYAQWLNAHGVAAFVLKYRLGSHGYRHPVMLEDAARAVRLVRSRALEWKIDPHRLGIMGSSAGGHLASTLLTHFDAGSPQATDPIERQSSRPDLGVLCYAVISMGPTTHAGSRQNLLGDNPSPELVQSLSNELQVTPQTPPCFLWHTWEDPVVKVENSLDFAQALRRNGVHFDLHIYEHGGHGMGLGDDTPPFRNALPWTNDLLFWLKGQGFLTAADRPAAQAQAATPDGPWNLVWSDEFNKDGAPDPKNWGFEQGFARNQEAQWYQSDNARVQNGMLVIEARRERKPNPRYDAASGDWKRNRQFAEYTSASLTTGGKHSWTYGRWVMRAKIDTRPGLWPAFWTVGTSGEWPSGGELDIMEYYNDHLLANAAWGTAQRWNAKWDSVRKPLTEFHDADWSNKFHVWRMDWDENWIRMYVDDQLMNEVDLSKTLNPDGSNPFHAPQSIILNLAIGGQNGGDPSHTAFPARYIVDYVRIYQKRKAP